MVPQKKVAELSKEKPWASHLVDPSSMVAIKEDAPICTSADVRDEITIYVFNLQINHEAVSIRSCFLLLGLEKKQN